MKSSIDLDPCLEDVYVKFHTDFTLIDLGMNTSEIKPLHLAIPKIHQQSKSPKASPSVETKPQGKRVLNQKLFTKPDKSGETNLASSIVAQAGIRVQGSNVESNSVMGQTLGALGAHPKENNNSNNNANNNNNNANDTQQNQDLVTLSIQNGISLTDMDDFWFYPLPSQKNVRYSFIVDASHSVGLVFHLVPVGLDKKVLTAVMEGPTREHPIKIYAENSLIGESRYTPNNTSISFGITRQQPETEACAILFNQSFSSPSQPRVFDFLIPALKKIEGRSRMFPIPFGVTSGLIAKLTEMRREAIRLRSRVPQNKKGNASQYDMCFNNLFPQSSLTNFILYHEQSPQKNICEFGMDDDGIFSLQISYPMSPIQGFLAGVAASMPF